MIVPTKYKKKIFSQAHSLKKNNPNFNISECLKLSWYAYKLYYDMQGGNIVEFAFRKQKTGEIRKAFGTLASDRKDPDRRFENVFLYFDAEKNDLRSFKIENLVLDEN